MPTIEGPDGSLRVTVDDDGAPTLAASREGRSVIEPSQLGIDHRRSHFRETSRVVDVDRRGVTETFTTAAGKRREHEHRATEAAITVADEDHAERATLIVRVATDGVAFRYRLDTDRGSHLAERTAIEAPSDTVAWAHPYDESHEATGVSKPLDELAGGFTKPLLYRTSEDWVLVTEAGADGRFAASRIQTDSHSHRLEYAIPPSSIAWGDPPVTTPWRVAIVGDRSTVVESSLVPALVTESELSADADWIEPGRVAWSWWSDGESPEDPERQREFVDYAAERGWEYVLVDAGWQASWLPDVVEYAEERDVGVFCWCHYTQLNTPADRQRRLERFAEWGLDGLKIDFMNSDDQGRLQFYDTIAEAAAEYELLLNFHGSVVPTGLERRYPHVLTYEGIYGAEQMKSSAMAPSHNTIVPFTRNAVGPMDFTPVTFTTPHRHTSDGHELALSVVFESGLQHFADSVEAYSARPHAEWTLERVPAAWDETRFLGGWPGVETTIARRSDDDWFVGAIANGQPRRIETSCSFLEEPREGALVRDGEDDLVRETIRVDPDEPIGIDVPENGGFVVVLER